MYYKLSSETTFDTKISPVPVISYNQELKYANDTIIGYTHIVNLNGYATNIEDTDSGIEGNLNQIDRIRKIFAKNGADLIINNGTKNILRGFGGTVRSLSFEESPNYLNNYIPYSVEIEFNEFFIDGCEELDVVQCNNSLLVQSDRNSDNNTAPNLVDTTQYKIKDFTDNWSITLDDTVYDNYGPYKNSTVQLQYTISATGKNQFILGTSSNLVPAWEQARIFVQDRLYKQVKQLISGIQYSHKNENTSCDATAQHKNLYRTDTTRDGLFEGFVTDYDTGFSNYGVYNETINCQTSESEGTFSATYSCIIKESAGIDSSKEAATHTYSVTKSYDQSSTNSASWTINGTVQGLIRGGLIFQNTQFTLPQNGSFISTVDSNETRYTNAYRYYYGKVGTASDLYDSIKNDVGLSYWNLLISSNSSGLPMPQTFQLDHNYNDGTIGYSATYSTEHAKSILNGYTNISVTRKEPTRQYKEFVIPGRSQGPIIQDLGMTTSRTVSINIDGVRQNKQCLSDIQNDLCSYMPSYSNIPGISAILSDSNSWIVTKKHFSTNVIDGSFSVSLEYLCSPPMS